MNWTPWLRERRMKTFEDVPERLETPQRCRGWRRDASGVGSTVRAGRLRLGEDSGGLLEDPVSRPGPSGLTVHPDADLICLPKLLKAAETRRRATVGCSLTSVPQDRTAALHPTTCFLRTNQADQHDHTKRRLQNLPLTPFFRSLIGWFGILLGRFRMALSHRRTGVSDAMSNRHLSHRKFSPCILLPNDTRLKTSRRLRNFSTAEAGPMACRLSLLPKKQFKHA